MACTGCRRLPPTLDRFHSSSRGRSLPTSFRCWRWTEDAPEASAKITLVTAKLSGRIATGCNRLVAGSNPAPATRSPSGFALSPDVSPTRAPCWVPARYEAKRATRLFKRGQCVFDKAEYDESVHLLPRTCRTIRITSHTNPAIPKTRTTGIANSNGPAPASSSGRRPIPKSR
jgi:hypothetical protein